MIAEVLQIAARTEGVLIKLTPEIKEKISVLSEEHGMKMATFIAFLVGDYVNKNAK